MSEFADMNDLAESYSDSLHVVCLSKGATNTYIKNYWNANGCTLLHNFHGDVDSAVMYPYGFSGSLGFKVLFDRDGNIRKTGGFLHDFLEPIEHCTGGS